jgi:hypothetical protein
MVKTGLFGPYILSNESIDKHVVGIGVGAYALGRYEKETNSFYVDYIGRSDENLNNRLHQHEKDKYSYFKYGFYPTVKDAFVKECNLWHDFGGPKGKLDNKNHPDRPKGANWKCPVCVIFD